MNKIAPRRHAAFLLLALLSWSTLVAKAPPAAAPAPAEKAASGYRLPPAALQAIVDAPRPPQLLLGPKRDLAALMQVPPLPSIETVAQPELKLAGMRINPRTYSDSRFSFGSDLWLMEVGSGKELRIEGLPQPLSIATTTWSPDQSQLAFNHVDPRSGANELWVVDVATRRARRIASDLNTVAGRGYHWLPDSRRLLVTLRAGGEAPVSDGVPTEPNIQQTGPGGTVRSMRTYQDLLKNEHDAKTFEHYLRSQLALVSLDGTQQKLGSPEMRTTAAPSPDGRHVLSVAIERPFSYLVPVHFFPQRIEVLGLDGRVLHTVAKRPLVEGLPTGNDAVPTGVRAIGWRSDAPAALVWAEARDGGDPAVEADVRDEVLIQAAPFKQAPAVLARLGSRYAGAEWGRGDLALVDEYWWKTRQTKRWRVAPDAPSTAPVLLHEGSSEDRYNDPGDPVTVRDAAGFERLLVGKGDTLFLIGDGASPEGDRPFVDRWQLADGSKSRLFHSQAPHYEYPYALLDDAGQSLLTRREAPSDPPNYFVRNGDGTPRALTRFEHPAPQLKGVTKEQIRYKRKDGVELTGNLYLPPGYDPKRDGPLPLLMWAYPAEFKSASAASQVTDSPYRFNAIGYWGPQPFLARGFAVLDDPSMPIVGEGDAEPNDTYVEQLVASAEAAVDEVVRRGVADRNRIAVGGHSYGAFMTANLLAHTRLFKAGIARSGAYNRSLTPFGFQAEERNYWQARDTYTAMSPFNHAQTIKDPLLIIHGEQDNNSGTFPIQSERLFAAIKGLGGNARLVMLPNESHGYRARESILHMLAETDAWLEQHVKNAAVAAPASTK
ncbi:S9 family peptidase [Lysobacter korlensis]|uniref:S9 family peptidase n=1 Tax=Lysobacter korlensis TaxID=553636 RepID=A0ABV6RK10_9GAMM